MKKVFLPLLICLVFLFSACDPAIDAKPEDNAKIEAVVKALAAEKTPSPSELIVTYDTKFTDYVLEDSPEGQEVKLNGNVLISVNMMDESSLYKGDFTLRGVSEELDGHYIFEISGKGEDPEKQSFTKDGTPFDSTDEKFKLVNRVIQLAGGEDSYQSPGLSMTITYSTSLAYSGNVKGTVKQVSKMSVKDGSISGTVNVDVSYKSDAIKAVISVSGKEEVIENVVINEISLNGKALKPGSISSEVKNSIKALLNSENSSI